MSDIKKISATKIMTIDKTFSMLLSIIDQRESKLNSLNNTLIDLVGGLSFIDTNGYYQIVNKKYSDICGYDEGELDGISWRKTVNDLESANLCYYEMLALGKSHMEFKGIKKDGTIFTKSVTLIKSEEEGTMNGHYCFMCEVPS